MDMHGDTVGSSPVLITAGCPCAGGGVLPDGDCGLADPSTRGLSMLTLGREAAIVFFIFARAS